ncbi:MAG: LytR C-terminal domain-containing protein [Solirubrobacterales bacterium]
MEAIQQIGAIAGLGAFLGLAVLAFLYFTQAHHVRDLEEKASFVPDELDLPATAPEPATVAATEEGETATATATAPAGKSAAPRKPQSEAEAARQIEIARAKAERRARFEQRRRSPGGGGGPPQQAALGSRRMPEPRAMIVIGLGVVVLVVGVVFGAGRILGGDEGDSGGTTGSSGAAEESTGPPTEVAVLNGTPVPGLAATVGQDVRDGGFKLGAVTNTDTPFAETTVMFDQGKTADGQEVAKKLQISAVEPMSSDVKKIANGAPVAVVVGEDRAGT